ncbi:AzlD domain-containing protein [Herbidospora mongoliensis]|uniref:AzlD domain-containing protein n=1 Tax=Herbidospora mongoliensis TaxID=688067 RepID=UPI00082B5192|nr:AzlD domain-containing protein [Herbidospora mongoliensis]
MNLWWAVIATCLGCYLLKYAGLAAPRKVLDHPAVKRFATIVPVALLAALIAVQSFGQGFDGPRTAGLAAAVIALLLRAPFLLVLVVAAVVTGLLRITGM